MIIHSKYTKIFRSHDMTRLKYNELYDFAVLIRNHKNIVSEYVNQNLLHFLEYNKFMFLKEMREPQIFEDSHEIEIHFPIKDSIKSTISNYSSVTLNFIYS